MLIRVGTAVSDGDGARREWTQGGPCFCHHGSSEPAQSMIGRNPAMCRNIRTLFNFEPPATEEEIHASALQFVRKLSGFNKPSHANAEAFDRAVEEVSDAARRLLTSLHTTSPAR